MEACHCDGNCLNDAADNLRWDTTISNKRDMIRHGTRIRGEKVDRAKLNEDAIRDIRKAGYPCRPPAEKHNVTIALISMIPKRKIWTHVA